MSAGKEDKLRAKIAAFEKELEGQRLLFTGVGGFVIAVSAVLAGADAGSNIAAKLVHQIEATIGQAKDAQDAELAARLPMQTEQRKLVAPRKEEAPIAQKAPKKVIEDFSRGPEFDDEIPF